MYYVSTGSFLALKPFCVCNTATKDQELVAKHVSICIGQFKLFEKIQNKAFIFFLEIVMLPFLNILYITAKRSIELC